MRKLVKGLSFLLLRLVSCGQNGCCETCKCIRYDKEAKLPSLPDLKFSVLHSNAIEVPCCQEMPTVTTV